ncbi:hypothetical protein [Salinarimonas soli]|uniref:Uncharacterized protein n=1 Tax=Salinarimonas soli TaxID=1638099 RepID=A0A5B2V9K2_9HYPH|nr:hypothetical protein [Salinarimonas soli]KAA2235526.1 hypothetical protein F0L46_18660 [Salinarimonas soli]
MSSRAFPVAAVLGLLCAAPAWASPCGDQLRTLEPQVDAAASRSVSLSSGGQGVAASRESQAMQAERGQKPTPPVQSLPEHDVNATAAARPLEGGDRAMKARTAFNEAQALDRDGDAAGCMSAVERVRRELEASR